MTYPRKRKAVVPVEFRRIAVFASHQSRTFVRVAWFGSIHRVGDSVGLDGIKREGGRKSRHGRLDRFAFEPFEESAPGGFAQRAGLLLFGGDLLPQLRQGRVGG